MRIQNNNHMREPTRVARTSRRRRVVLELDLYSVKGSTKASPESTSHHARNLRLMTLNLGCGNIVKHRKIFIYVPYAITALEIFSDCVGSMGIWFLLTGIFVSQLFQTRRYRDKTSLILKKHRGLFKMVWQLYLNILNSYFPCGALALQLNFL